MLFRSDSGVGIRGSFAGIQTSICTHGQSMTAEAEISLAGVAKRFISCSLEGGRSSVAGAAVSACCLREGLITCSTDGANRQPSIVNTSTIQPVWHRISFKVPKVGKQLANWRHLAKLMMIACVACASCAVAMTKMGA